MLPAVNIPEPAASLPSGVYDSLMANAFGLPNDKLFAQMIAAQIEQASALPAGLGLDQEEFEQLLSRHFPGIGLDIGRIENVIDPRALERDDVLALLMDYRCGLDPSELWMAKIVTTACMANDHLWQDLGLWSRAELTQLMQTNFAELAARNTHNMKWKKFLYKQLCEREEIRICRAPSCAVCADYAKCFGPED
jgi:nitrogen fixation protein NifQ